MAVRLVFVDLDDTFVSPDKTITVDNLRVLDLALERGVGIAPCTGRSVDGIPAGLASHPSVRYAVCAGGAVIYDLRASEVLRELPIEKDLVLDLYGAVRDLPVAFDVLADGARYLEPILAALPG
ncbi:MAG: HAD hydrolase family protein [Atopobiaceae bacterium]|nr:HAD hydrolase family protein [Atopobiaceae bacterium]